MLLPVRGAWDNDAGDNDPMNDSLSHLGARRGGWWRLDACDVGMVRIGENTDTQSQQGEEEQRRTKERENKKIDARVGGDWC